MEEDDTNAANVASAAAFRTSARGDVRKERSSRYIVSVSPDGGDGDDSMLVVSSLEGVEEDTVAIVSFVLSVWCAPLNGWTRG